MGRTPKSRFLENSDLTKSGGGLRFCDRNSFVARVISMTSQLLTPVAAPVSSRELGCECRVYERHACGLPSRCQPASAFGKEELKWSGTLENVSKGGVCLSLSRRFEAGTGLAIELPAHEGK